MRTRKQGQHSAYVFAILFLVIISVFVTLSVLKTNDDIPTGLIVDEHIQQQINEEKALKDEQQKTCDYELWFKRFTCNLGIYNWFYKDMTTTTVYTLDEEGNVVDATVVADEASAQGEVSIELDN